MQRHFGSKVEDSVTGFEGMLVGFCTYATGCNQGQIQPKAKEDGTFVEPEWFDEQRIRIIEDRSDNAFNDHSNDLGCLAQDVHSGFRGRVMGIITRMEGAVEYLLIPRVRDDGTVIGGQWFDRKRVRAWGEDRMTFDNGANPGCDNTPKPR